MKNSFLNIVCRSIVACFLFCILVLMQISTNFLVSAQTVCNNPAGTPIPDPRGNPSHWAQNAPVQVHVNSSSGQFTQNEYDTCIKPAFDDFNTANLPATIGGNSSGVTFSITFSSTIIAHIDGNTSANEPGITRGFQINKGNPDPSEGDPNQKTGGVTYLGDDGSYRISAVTIMNSQITSCTALKNQVAHEIGHTMGLDHYCGDGASLCYSEGATIMNNLLGLTENTSDFNNETYGRGSPSPCDNEVIKCKVYQIPPCPTPTPTPTPPVGTLPGGGACVNPRQNFAQGACPYGFTSDTTGYYCCQTGCPISEDDEVCTEQRNDCEANNGTWKGCCRGCFSPIVIDVLGNGFDLTDGNHGVELDLTGEGAKDKISWTAPNSDDAWLVLDRNNNGTIDNALEMFGNFTAQPDSIPVKDRNGFLALAVFDKPENGGNSDGKINKQDAIYTKLRLWQDANHNGISEPNELHALNSLDVRTIFLDYKESRKKDGNGNRFRYRSRVRDSKDADVGKFAWDVFLVKPK